MAGTSGPKVDESDQISFVKKVLGIVSAQLLISFIILIAAAVNPQDTDFRTCAHPVIVSYTLSGLACMNSFGAFLTTVGC